jgi:hypothetical protein
MILSARDVGGFPPPIGLYAGGWTRLLRGADRERGCGGSESAGFRTLTELKPGEEQSFDSTRTTGK